MMPPLQLFSVYFHGKSTSFSSPGADHVLAVWTSMLAAMLLWPISGQSQGMWGNETNKLHQQLKAFCRIILKLFKNHRDLNDCY